jgi:hypothetical protein
MRPIGCIIRNATRLLDEDLRDLPPNSGSIWSIWLSAALTIRSLMRSSISWLRSENVADAQLPAYCFMPMRNETYCGLSAPSTIGNSAITRTMPSSAGSMSPTP